MANDNFVDLRVSHAGSSGGEDSVWPSFTDIMTVIVMIFLMALLAFLIRNTQLVDTLKSTIQEKDAAAQSALLNAAQNSTLQQQLDLVRAQVLSLQSTLEEVSQQRLTLEQTLEAKEKAVADLEVEIALLSRLRDELTGQNAELLADQTATAEMVKTIRLDLEAAKNTLNEKIALLLAEKAELVVSRDKSATELSASEQEKAELNKQVIAITEQLRLMREKVEAQASENAELTQNLEDRNTLMLGLQTSKEELEKKLAEMTAELQQLTALYTTRGDEVAALQAELTGSSQRYKSLQEELDTLDQKYRKLIRPARSTAGKHVVHVEYRLVGGQPRYLLGEPGETPAPVSEAVLHQRLAALKAEHKQQLYTKVVIPNDSGLSYNAAWAFTQSILSKYDYYAQDFSTQPSE